MTIDRVILSYKLSLFEVGIITLLVVTEACPSWLGLFLAGLTAGMAWRREEIWLKNSG